jgi:hypothetical protein
MENWDWLVVSLGLRWPSCGARGGILGKIEMLQLSLNGLQEGAELEKEEIRREFALRHCVFLKGFLHPSLLQRIKGLMKTQNYFTRADHDTEVKVFAREVTLRHTDPMANLMFMLLNQKGSLRSH